MCRPKLRLLLVTVLLAVVGFYPLLAPTPHRIDAEHFALVSIGMRRDQVEAIFGVPPGKYDGTDLDRPAIWQGADSASSGDIMSTTIGYTISVDWPPPGDLWAGRNGAFAIHFDNRGRVGLNGARAAVRILPPWQRWWDLVWKK
jgi:hypothetical protein